MDTQYLQSLRYKLQKRVRRLNSVQGRLFHFALRQFWGFLQDHGILLGIIEDLQRRHGAAESKAEVIVEDRQALAFDSELESVAVSCFLLKRCVDSDNQSIESKVGVVYPCREPLDAFRDLFVEPFYEYLDEHIDDQRAILALLRRYKQKCEWFQRERLYGAWEDDTKHGERNLALHLYEYLHEQGLDFVIEPSSISGEADLVGAQKTDDPLIADAKIFNPDRGHGKNYIARGFCQIYTYTRDYNEPFGYLIIYNTSDRDLRLTLAKQEQSTPCVVHNGKTIFLLTIDICPHQVPASKRGDLKTVEITEDDLVKVVRDGEESPAG